MPQGRRECLKCSNQYDVLVFGGDTWAIYHPVFENQALSSDEREQLIRSGYLNSCPNCFSRRSKKLVTSAIGINLGDVGGVGKFFPRFDKGLGIELRSDAHRRQVCAERGLIPTEGASGWIEHHEQREAVEDAAENEYQAYQNELMADGDVRRVMDRLEAARDDGGQEGVIDYLQPQARQNHPDTKPMTSMEAISGES